MAGSRGKRIITGLALLAAALLSIQGIRFLWDIVLLLILASIAAVFGLSACRSWHYRRAGSEDKP